MDSLKPNKYLCIFLLFGIFQVIGCCAGGVFRLLQVRQWSTWYTVDGLDVTVLVDHYGESVHTLNTIHIIQRTVHFANFPKQLKKLKEYNNKYNIIMRSKLNHIRVANVILHCVVTLTNHN